MAMQGLTPAFPWLEYKNTDNRILKGIAEFNEAPVPFRWKKFDLGLA